MFRKGDFMLDLGPKVRTAGKLGRKLGSEKPGKLMLHDYLVDGLPVWNGPDDFTSAVTQWGMLGNDLYGDCGFAGRVHYDMANAWTASEQPVGNISASVWPTYAEVVTAYFTYEGSPGGVPNTADDNGVELDQVLEFWLTNELANLPTIGGYAQIDVSSGPEFQAAIHLFGGLYAGINVSQEAMDEFSAGQPWTSTATDWTGGHCIPILQRNILHGTAITWGVQQQFSWPWWRACRSEGWVIFTKEQMAAPGGVFNGVQVAQLAQDISTLHGTVAA